MSAPDMLPAGERILTVDQVVASVREQADAYAAAQLQPHQRSKAFLLTPASLQELLKAAWVAGHAGAVRDLQHAIEGAVKRELKPKKNGFEDQDHYHGYAVRVGHREPKSDCPTCQQFPCDAAHVPFTRGLCGCPAHDGKKQP